MPHFTPKNEELCPEPTVITFNPSLLYRFSLKDKIGKKAIIPLPPARNGGHPQGGGFREIVLLNDFPEDNMAEGLSCFLAAVPLNSS